MHGELHHQAERDGGGVGWVGVLQPQKIKYTVQNAARLVVEIILGILIIRLQFARFNLFGTTAILVVCFNCFYYCKVMQHTSPPNIVKNDWKLNLTK